MFSDGELASGADAEEGVSFSFPVTSTAGMFVSGVVDVVVLV